MSERRVHVDGQWLALAVVTGLAVVFDASVVPFYPTIFAHAFGVDDPVMVGTYLSVTCLVAMVTFLGWGWLEQRVPTLALVMTGQVGAMLLSIACAEVPQVHVFWWLSLGMIACKSSYLLVYPYLLRTTDVAFHGRTIGILTVVVHVGGVVGATMGGGLLTLVRPQHIYYVLAVGDVLQFGVCAWLFVMKASEPMPLPTQVRYTLPWRSITGLGFCMLLFYLGLFGVQPFFVEYWIYISGWDNLAVAGLVFSIPAWMSLLALVLRMGDGEQSENLLGLCVAGAIGLVLQMAPSVWVVILGRSLFGLAVYQALVRLDVLAFKLVPQEAYTQVFGIINIYQQLGALISFYLAGELVAKISIVTPFMMAAIAFMASWVVFSWSFSVRRQEGVVSC